MTITRIRTSLAVALVALSIAAPASAQDAMTRAKTYYASAAYEEALQVLVSIGATNTSDEARDVAAYQMLCLVALGRTDEAKRAIETIVKLDPLFHPSEAQASPRVRAFFEDTRRPMLPDVVKTAYTRGKDAFEKKEMPVAAGEFEKVISLIDEAGPAVGSSDMRTLAAGFRDLAKAATPPPPPPKPDPLPPPPAPEPPPAPVKPAAPAPDPSRVYTPDDPDVVRPVVVSRTLPGWSPANDFEAKQIFRGTLELLVDERGRVVSATMTKSVRPAYDAELLKAVKGWSFKPATRKGVAVKYIYRMEVQVGKSPRPSTSTPQR